MTPTPTGSRVGAFALVVAAILATAPGIAGVTATPLPPLPPPRPPERPSPPPVPLPPPRPDMGERPAYGPPAPPPPAPRARPQFGPPAPSLAIEPPRGAIPALPAPPVAPDAAPGEDAACVGLLASGIVDATREPPLAAPGGCGIAVPVDLRRVVLKDGRSIAIEPPARIRCALARQVADWLRDDLADAATREGGLLALTGVGGYECRSRDHVFGAKLSEHGTGNAIDIAAFRFIGHDVPVLAAAGPAPFLARVKETACARFATVLGPGSDGFHAFHLHVDLAARRNSFHLCQWTFP